MSMATGNPEIDALDPVTRSAVVSALKDNPGLAELPADLQADAMQTIVEATQEQRQIARKLIGELEASRDKIIKDRADIEQRWVDDTNQYEGESLLPHSKDYATDVGDRRRETAPKVNLTRSRTNMAAARIADMLFPANDRNWDVQELDDKIRDALKKSQETQQAPAPGQPDASQPAQAPDASMQPDQTGQPPDQSGQMPQQPQQGQPQPAQDQAPPDPSVDNEDRCDAMRETIQNQLDDSWYSEHGRRMIEDGCRLGIGVLKGPFTRKTTRKKFSFSTGTDGKKVAMLDVVESRVPQCERVDPRFFYPQNVRDMNACERVFELHLMSRAEIKELAKQDGIDMGAAELLLTMKPELGQIGKNLEQWNQRCVLHDSYEGKYAVWEMHGVFSKDELESLGMEDLDDISTIPVAEVWFCQGEVLRVNLSVLEADTRPPYWAWNYERADDTMYGYGVPWLYRNSQRSIDSLWLMLLHNLSVSSGPQIIFKDGVIKPVDGRYEIRGPKAWRCTDDDVQDVSKAFAVVDIPNNADQAMAVLKLSMDLGDEEIALPSIAQGNPNEAVPTASGLIQLLNASNIVQRRAAKSMDDDVISPMVERFYVWNMLHGQDDDIKGDFAVSARGTSVLLHKDIKAQHLQVIAKLTEDPRFAPYLKEGQFIREMLESADVSATLLLRSDQEVEKMQAAQAQGGDPVAAAKAQALQAQTQLAEQKMKNDMQEFQEKQAQAAAEFQQRAQQHQADLQDRAEQRQAQILIKQMELQANAAQLATTKDISMAQITKDLQIAESSANVTQFLGSMNARLKAASFAKDQQEMQLKLDPANRSGTGI